MNLKELAGIINAEVISDVDLGEINIPYAYASDQMSDVLASVHRALFSHGTYKHSDSKDSTDA